MNNPVYDIPNLLLKRQDTRPLVEWLRNRGLSMTLADLDSERRRRGIHPPMRKKRDA